MRMYSGCPLCGSTEIHACIGRRLPAPTQEEEERLTETLKSIFPEVSNTVVPDLTSDRLQEDATLISGS
jgi:hypothetical protein